MNPEDLFDGNIEDDARTLEGIIVAFQEQHEKILRMDHSRDLDVIRNELKSIAGDPWDDGSVEYPDGYPENADERMARLAKEEYRVMVASSHGEILIETENGDVIGFSQIDREPEDFDFGRITRFDVREWEEHYQKRLSDFASVDILDIGYWYMTGDPDTTRPIGVDYEPPVETVRAQIAKNLRELGSK